MQELSKFAEILKCPKCGGDLHLSEDQQVCADCAQQFGMTDGIPLLFWPNDWDPQDGDITFDMKAFYEETPFPNYDAFDSVGSLIQKSNEGVFTRLLDEQIPVGARVIECGCGTGQLSNFLSIAKRTVFGTDMCLNSLRLGQEFKEKNGLERVNFMQMNLFRPAFKPETFDLVISNGVIHHTSDPFLAYKTLATLVKPGGFLLIGLYHKYGRILTDVRRHIFNASNNKFKFLDARLRKKNLSDVRKDTWFMDQYKNPHESKHTIGEVLGWLEETGLTFVSSIPKSRPMASFSDTEKLFQPEQPGNALQRFMVEFPMMFSGSEGGFFIVIARKTATAANST